MEAIDLYRHLKTVIADLQRLQEIDRDPSILTIQEGRERLAGALEKCVGLAEMLRRDGLGETVQ